MALEMLTAKEAAEELGVTDARVRQWLIKKVLRGTKHANAWMISRAEVERFKRQRDVEERDRL